MSKIVMTQSGRLDSPRAGRYLQQLCKHFAHKVAVRCDAVSGEAALPPGPARLAADSGRLTVEISAADAAGLAQARDIIDRHLERFAFREARRTLEWDPPAGG